MSIFDFNFSRIPTSGVLNSEAIGKLATQEEVSALATAIAKGLQNEFAQGGHNRSGDTVESVKVHLGPMSAEVSMAGGATFVEYGFKPHYIEAVNAQSLHWEADAKFSEGYARPGIQVSGYAGDPFVQRALNQDIDYSAGLDVIAKKIFDSYMIEHVIIPTPLPADPAAIAEAEQITEHIPLIDVEATGPQIEQIFPGE